MESLKSVRSYQWLKASRLGIAVGLAALFLVLLRCELNSMSTAYADPGILYVDGATGQDVNACGTVDLPCRTISYTLNIRAGSGDAIRVAQGVYTENLTVDKPVVLEGGYVLSATLWLTPTGETLIDGSNNRTVWGDWDGMQVGQVAVLNDGIEHKMWFDGVNLLGETQIGLATSDDGSSWTKYLANPVLTGTTGAWDESGEHTPYVLKEGGIYKMWYEGSDGDVRRLGYATSTNGIDWNKYPGNPILTPGPDGYDQGFVGHGSVLSDGGSYKLWYHAAGDQGCLIAYATSSDGITGWAKSGPVLATESDSWDEYCVWGPSVLKSDGAYWMWYSAWGEQGGAIGVVTSTNGITWTRFLTRPVVTDTTSIGYPHVISESGKLKMWYQEWDRGTVNYAESTDGISWIKSPSNPVLTPGTSGQWGQPVVAFIEGSDGSVLDGFTVRNGQARHGGGINVAAAQVVIQNCVVMGNSAYWSGGGINVDGKGANVMIHHSQVLSNAAGDDGGGIHVVNGAMATIMDNDIVSNTTSDGGGGGVAINDWATATVTANRVLSNTSDGWASGGILVGGAVATIQSNEIVGNKGQGPHGNGGIRVGFDAVVTISNNLIRSNEGHLGGGICVSYSSVAAVYSNTIDGNQADDAGGMFLGYNSTVTLDRNTITNNAVNGGGGGIAIQDSIVTVTNNVIASNSGPDGDGIIVWNGGGTTDVKIINNTIVSNTDDAVCAGGGTVLVRNNILYGNGNGGINVYGTGATVTSDHNDFWNNAWLSDVPTGTGDIEADPLFVDASNGDYRLQDESPCIDAGTATGAPIDDIEGTPRDAVPDMGAYEWTGFQIYLPAVVRSNP